MLPVTDAELAALPELETSIDADVPLVASSSAYTGCGTEETRKIPAANNDKNCFTLPILFYPFLTFCDFFL